MESLIEKCIEESLRRVLGFYERMGTPLSYYPNTRYVDCSPSVVLPGYEIIAISGVEINARYRCLQFLYRTLARVIWREAYGIVVSDEAIDELIAHLLDRIKIPEFEEDIVIFKPFKYLEDEQRDEIIAHELWHLIEEERGLFDRHPFIVEATATYARKRFRNERCDIPPEECDLVEMLRLGGANVVQQYVENSPNPYKAMLDPNLRERIQKELLKRVEPIIVQKAKESLRIKDVRFSLASILQQYPEFEELRNNLTPEGIITFYRKIGAYRLADELEAQKEKLKNLIKEFEALLLI